jgi:hypothetical protein
VIIFGLVRFLSKKSNQTKIFFLKKRTETGSNRPVSVWFFSSKNQFKTVFFGLARYFFPVWLGFFSGLGLVFLVLGL